MLPGRSGERDGRSDGRARHDTLRRAAYTDSAVFKAERDKVFRGGWIALLFDHQLPDPGDQVPVDAAGLPLVAVRDRAGDVRVFHNVCRHRASLVVPMPVRGQPTMRCPYHGWAYGLDGALRATPLWDGQRVTSPEALDRSRLGLREVRCGVWSGVVWIDLSGAAPPLAEHVAPLTALWRDYEMEKFLLAHYETGQIEANWKLAIEASIENYHELFVHEKLPARLDAAAPTFTDVAHGEMFGFVTEADAALRSATPPVPLRDPSAKRVDNLCYLFPNGQQNLFGGLAVRTVWVPLAVDRCEWRTSWYFVGEAADDAAHRPARDEVVAFWRQLRAEDKRTIEWMQLGRGSPVADELLLSPFWSAPSARSTRSGAPAWGRPAMPDSLSSGRRVVLTGSSGRLGRHIARALRGAGHDVLGFDRAPAPDGESGVQGSILDADALAAACAGADAVVHAAALLTHGNTQAEIFEVNTRGTWTVFDAATRAGVRRVVAFSSECAVGQCFQRVARPPRYLPIDEAHPLEPQDAYSLSKQLGEAIAAGFRRAGGPSVVILRPTWVMFPIRADELAARRALDHGDLWCYVAPADVAAATVAAVALDTDFDTFFLGAPNTLCDEPTLDRLRARWGVLPDIRRPELYAADPTASIYDSSRAREKLGFAPVRSWRDLIVQT